MTLLKIPEWWEEHWQGMPEFVQEDLTPWKSIAVNFKSEEDLKDFCAIIGQNIPATKTRETQCIWHPKAEIGRIADKRYVADSPVNPRHPVYVISKGRWESRLTVKALERMGIPHHVVIEPQEYDDYAEVISPERLLILPFSNLGQGSIPARNWVWEHSVSNGAERHWILDDNIDGFYRLNHNLKVQVSTGATFRAAEDFVDRYENVAISGFHYFMFASRKSKMAPFTLNSRVYSCILIRNDLPHRWRGRYNEDTDLSLRVLKDGWCTVLFLAFLALKQTTMTMKGGNTDELYQGDGRLRMAESLAEQHPEVTKVTKKWGRYQHHVDYSHFKPSIFKGFERNRLIRKPGLTVPNGVDNYGMRLEIDDGG
jgi:hypothetical protein